MRDDTGPGPQLALQLRHQLLIEPCEQEQRDDGRLADVGLEQVLLNEPDAIADAGLRQVVVRFPDANGIDLDADSARAVLCGGANRDAAVARPQVVDDVGRRDARQLEHRLHDTVGRGHELHIGRLQRRKLRMRRRREKGCRESGDRQMESRAHVNLCR